MVFLFVVLFRTRLTRKKTIAAAYAGMGILMLMNGIILVVYGIDVLGKIFLLTCSIPSFIFLYLISADKRFRFLLTFCLADTTCLWLMAVTNLMDYFLGGGKYVLMFISRMVVFPLVEYLAWRYLRKPYHELQASVEKGWGVFAGMTMLYYLLLTVAVQFPTNIINRPEDVFLCILILVLMLFNYATIFTSLYRQLLLFRKQRSERILQEQRNMLKAQLENQQRIRRMKHDMKGHTVTLTGLLCAGKNEEALAYLKGVEKNMDALEGQFCANPYINAVFVQYSGRLEELGAKSVLDIQAGEEELPYMDLCQILSNGLENACDALEALDAEKREIFVHMKYNRNYLTIRIKNRCRDELFVEKGKIPVTEKSGHDHGFGLATVQEAAGRLGGDMLCYTEEGYFILEVMVSLQSLRNRMEM